MIEENKIDKEYLRKLYIEDLSRIVTYKVPPKPRVKHPGKWAKLESIVSLSEGIDEPLSFLPETDDRKIWVWSDLHFYHKNIIRFSDRPYDDVRQMNEHLVANYNDCVGKNDICIWVGDVGFAADGYINCILDQCNGYKILIVGNHDFNHKKLRKLNFDETHLIYTLMYPDVSLVFTHYPMFNIPQPLVNIHGHLHAFPNPDSGHPMHINVNCEVQEYKPRLLSDIVEQAKLRVVAAGM